MVGGHPMPVLHAEVGGGMGENESGEESGVAYGVVLSEFLEELAMILRGEVDAHN